MLTDLKMRENALTAAILQDLIDHYPEMMASYAGQEAVMLSDIRFHLRFIREAVRYESIALMAEYVRWMNDFYPGIRVSMEHIWATFESIERILHSLCVPAEWDIVAPYLALPRQSATEQGETQTSFLNPANPVLDLAVAYFTHLRSGNRVAAAELIQQAVHQQQIPIRTLYLSVFQASLREVGRLWHIHQLTVAEEHYFTAATQLIMAQLYPLIFKTPRLGRKMIAACVGDELHEIGVRMIADFFEMEGWDSIYLGANTPVASLIDEVHKVRPSLIALSATLLPHIEIMGEIISCLKSDPVTAWISVVVGGYPFNVDQRLWRLIRADGYAADALSAVEWARSRYQYSAVGVIP